MFDFNTSTRIIKIIRGDSYSAPLYINIGKSISVEHYQLKDNDKLYFAVMEPNSNFEHAIIKQVYDKNSEQTEDGAVIIKLKPQDTEKLLTGQYYYTIKLQRFIDTDNYEVKTIIPNRNFWIC